MPETKSFDLIIVGGGLVGVSLALALSNKKLNIGIIELFEKNNLERPSYDDRAIALAFGTKKIFEGMEVWENISQHVEPIYSIHVSDKGNFGFTHLDAKDHGLPALGYVTTANQLGKCLIDNLKNCQNVEIFAPAKVTDVFSSEKKAEILVEKEGKAFRLNAPLLVAADGGKSFIREKLRIPTKKKKYNQTAIVANLTPEKKHENIAYERFTQSGPLALLPMKKNRCAIVWTVDDKDVEEIMQKTDKQFLDSFQEKFGYRLGKFEKVSKRSKYSLSLLRAKESVDKRIVIIGNAAHTLHPIAGQGFNLGLRDVAALVDVLNQCIDNQLDIGTKSVLEKYKKWRHSEQRVMAIATDSMASIFSSDSKIFRFGRNIGLLAIDFLPFARRKFSRSAMGLEGKLPTLSRGHSINKK